MTASIEIWEDTGPLVSGHGTTRTQVTNMNWKNSGTVEAVYNLAPLRRPDDSTGWTESYTKYLYFKIYGTWNKLKNFKVSIDAIPGTNTQLYGKMTSEYLTPSSALDGRLILINNAITFYPLLGTGGPEQATTFLGSVDSGEYYTQYLATQLRVINSVSSDVGNTADVKITLTFNEYE